MIPGFHASRMEKALIALVISGFPKATPKLLMEQGHGHREDSP